jgi:hypothetical protein
MQPVGRQQRGSREAGRVRCCQLAGLGFALRAGAGCCRLCASWLTRAEHARDTTQAMLGGAQAPGNSLQAGRQAPQECCGRKPLTQQVGVHKEEGGQEPAVLQARGPALVVHKLQQGADEEEGSSDDAAGREGGKAGRGGCSGAQGQELASAADTGKQVQVLAG